MDRSEYGQRALLVQFNVFEFYDIADIAKALGINGLNI